MNYRQIAKLRNRLSFTPQSPMLAGWKKRNDFDRIVEFAQKVRHRYLTRHGIDAYETKFATIGTIR